MKNNEIVSPKLKKKYEDNLKICNEFKGLNSLSNITKPSEENNKKEISRIENRKSDSTLLENSFIPKSGEPWKKKKKHSKKDKNLKTETVQLSELVVESNVSNSETSQEKKFKSDIESSEPPKKKAKSNEKHVLPKTYTLIQNIDSSITSNDLKNYLLENGISFDNVLVMSGSAAVANFERQKEMEKLFNICQGVQYKSNELFIFKIFSNNKSEQSYVSNLCENSIHVKNLDVTVTEDDISAILGELPIKSIALNSEKKTAVIEFDDNQSARTCMDLLDNKMIGDKMVQASFLVKSQRPDVFTLKLSNLPKDASKHDVQNVFQTATKIKFLKKSTGQCLIHFKNVEEFNDVINSSMEFFVKDVKVTIEKYVSNKTRKNQMKTQFVLNMFNLPFDTTVNELKGHYPGVRYIELLKNAEGNFTGSAKLMYDDKLCCEEALKSSKGKIFKHRRVRAEMKIMEYSRHNNDNKHDSSNNCDE